MGARDEAEQRGGRRGAPRVNRVRAKLGRQRRELVGQPAARASKQQHRDAQLQQRLEPLVRDDRRTPVGRSEGMKTNLVAPRRGAVCDFFFR